MKIAFFTEANYTGIPPRNHPNMRTDLAWVCSLNAVHISLSSIYTDEMFDLGIIIIPKSNPQLVFNQIDIIKSKCKKTAIMQEGPNWYWQDWLVSIQFAYLRVLNAVDLILVHNNSDIPYYSGLLNSDNVHVLPSLIIEDGIDYNRVCPKSQRYNTMIGGNMCSWYGGIDSYIVASEIPQSLIYVPSMGRKQAGEEQIQNVHHLNYMNWVEWLYELSKRKYGVHLMRTHAAGTFALACAMLGIPCIGYNGLDTQIICHPMLSVDIGDISTAKSLIKNLHTDEEFYNECSKTAQEEYQAEYSEKVFTQRFSDIYNSIQ